MAGTVSVSFQSAQRSYYGTPETQEIEVSVGVTVVGTFTPATIDYASFATTPQLFAAGTYDLTFTGLNPMGGDNTAFLDAVEVTVTPTGGPASRVPDDPSGYLGGLGYWQDPALADTAGSGLSYVRQRWLENATGQWLSVDPVATEPRYSYARNSPTMRTDPKGTFPPLDTMVDIALSGLRAAMRAAKPAQAGGPAFSSASSSAPSSTGTSRQPLPNAYGFYNQSTKDGGLFYGGTIPNVWDRPAHYLASRSNLPLWWVNFAPPADPGSQEAADWAYGLVAGIIFSLAQLIPAIAAAGIIADVIRFAMYLYQKHGAGNLIDFWAEDLKSVFLLFMLDQHLSAEERGFALGTVIGGIAAIIIATIATIQYVAAGGIIEVILAARDLPTTARTLPTRFRVALTKTLGERTSISDPRLTRLVAEIRKAQGAENIESPEVVEARLKSLVGASTNRNGLPTDIYDRPSSELSAADDGFVRQEAGDPTCASSAVATVLNHFKIKPDVNLLNSLAIVNEGLSAEMIVELLQINGVEAKPVPDQKLETLEAALLHD